MPHQLQEGSYVMNSLSFVISVVYISVTLSLHTHTHTEVKADHLQWPAKY